MANSGCQSAKLRIVGKSLTTRTAGLFLPHNDKETRASTDANKVHREPSAPAFLRRSLARLKRDLRLHLATAIGQAKCSPILPPTQRHTNSRLSTREGLNLLPVRTSKTRHATRHHAVSRTTHCAQNQTVNNYCADSRVMTPETDFVDRPPASPTHSDQPTSNIKRNRKVN